MSTCHFVPGSVHFTECPFFGCTCHYFIIIPLCTYTSFSLFMSALINTLVDSVSQPREWCGNRHRSVLPFSHNAFISFECFPSSGIDISILGDSRTCNATFLLLPTPPTPWTWLALKECLYLMNFKQFSFMLHVYLRTRLGVLSQCTQHC